MKQVKMTFNVDSKGNILNLENENLFKKEFNVEMECDSTENQNDFIINFINNLNGWSRKIITGVNFSKGIVLNNDEFEA